MIITARNKLKVMSGYIKINENKSWMVAGWVFRNVIEDSLPYIAKESNQRLLPALEKGFEGIEYIDLADVPLLEKKAFLRALEKALEEREAKGSTLFGDPSFYPGYIDRFKELVEMITADIYELGKRE